MASPQNVLITNIPHYRYASQGMNILDAKQQGITENASISVIVGDFQRIELYAQLGYQLPQYIPPEAWEAFHALVAMGFDKQLAK